MPSILCLELAPNQDLELQTNRSRKLLGVWCWDWYQNKAGELYFLFFLCTFIVFWFFTSVFSKNKTSTSQNVDIFRIRSNVDLPKMLDKILKIQNLAIRHLESLFSLWVDVLSKYELHTRLPHCVIPIPLGRPCLGELTTGASGRSPSNWNLPPPAPHFEIYQSKTFINFSKQACIESILKLCRIQKKI